MIKVIEDSEIEDITFKDNYILILCKKISSSVIKKLARLNHKVGIYCRNGFILDTVNGVISEISTKCDFSYELKLYQLEEKLLLGSIDYNVFYDFIKMKKYFFDYYKIILYWDNSKDICLYEKTTFFDKVGSGTLHSNCFKPVRQINVNENIFSRIKFVPDLEETLSSFVDETRIDRFYKDS